MKTKKQLVIDRINSGMTKAKEICDDIANEGIIIDMSFIHRILRRHAK